MKILILGNNFTKRFYRIRKDTLYFNELANYIVTPVHQVAPCDESMWILRGGLLNCRVQEFDRLHR